MPASVNAKTAQKHDYPSPEHRRSYARRSAAERAYATVKDPASNDLSRGWCRLMGLAPLALFAATVFVARNLRVADAFAARVAEDERRAADGLPPKRRRRRRQSAGESIADAHAPPGGQLDAQRVAERRGDLLELQDLFCIGLLVDAVNRRHAAMLEIPRHTFVRGQHEFLDDAVRDVALRARDTRHPSELIEFNFRFGQVEVNRAAALAMPGKNMRQLFH